MHLTSLLKKTHTFDLATKFSTLNSKYEFLHNNIKLLDFYNYVKLLTYRWKFLWMTMHIQRKLHVIFYLNTHVPNISLFSVDGLFFKERYLIHANLGDQNHIFDPGDSFGAQESLGKYFSCYCYLF